MSPLSRNSFVKAFDNWSRDKNFRLKKPRWGGGGGGGFNGLISTATGRMSEKMMRSKEAKRCDWQLSILTFNNRLCSN